MQTDITVEHLHADRFAIDIRGHRLIVDQPSTGTEREAGPTPTELLVASLASCTAHFAHSVVARDDPDATVGVLCSFHMSSGAPHRVEEIEMLVTVPTGLSAARRASVERAMQHCTVHESLRVSPRVVIALAPDRVMAATAEHATVSAA